MKKIFLLIFILFSCSRIYSQTVMCTWDHNVEADLAGYKVYMGEASRTYNKIFTVTKELNKYNITQMQYDVVYYLAVTAFDTANNESAFSNEVTFILKRPDTTPPDTVKGVKVAIVVEGEKIIIIKEE